MREAYYSTYGVTAGPFNATRSHNIGQSGKLAVEITDATSAQVKSSSSVSELFCSPRGPSSFSHYHTTCGSSSCHILLVEWLFRFDTSYVYLQDPDPGRSHHQLTGE